MAEEQQAGAVTEVEGAIGSAPSGDQGELQPGAVTEAGASPGEAESPGLDPKITQLISAEVARARGEWESEGGPFGKMQSKLTKHINDLEGRLRERQQADTKQALDLLDTDPATAAKQLAAQVQALTQQTQYQQFESQMDGYVRKSVEDLGLDIEDEETAKKVAGWMPRLLEDPTQWEGAFQRDLGQMSGERKDKELAQLRKQLDAQTEEIPKLIEQALARKLDDAGIGKVDLSPDGSPGKGSVHSKLAGKNIKDGLAAERKELERRQQQ